MAANPSRGQARLPLAVVLLGLTSFFSDVASEMIFPLLPAFLASLGASPVFLGLTEGVADAVSSLLKLASGYVADRTARRKPLVFSGYALAGLVRPLVALAQAPWLVLAVRVTDRVGKGIRTSPRDALIAKVAVPGEAGRAFGFHRSMDHAGAVLGPLLATGLLSLGVPLRHVFLWAALPGALSALMVLMVREPAAPAEGAKRAALEAGLPRELKSYLVILTLFSLANASDAFLLLRARELDVPTAHLPVLWSVFHVVKLLSSYAGGIVSDKVPRARLIVLGWLVYAAAYFGFGLAHDVWQIWALFIVYGAYYGLTEPAEKALVKDLTPEALHGRAFGYYNFVLGMSAIPAGALTGLLWEHYGARVALALGASVAMLAACLIALWERRRKLGQLKA